jgi:adenosine deaminase/adenosine deaminase CECR1
MKDYWLHMVMFNYCHTKFPDVKYSMHANLHNLFNRLTCINAVYTGSASDLILLYEQIIRVAAHVKKVAIEINLVSKIHSKSQRKPPSYFAIQSI